MRYHLHNYPHHYIEFKFFASVKMYLVLVIYSFHPRQCNKLSAQKYEQFSKDKQSFKFEVLRSFCWFRQFKTFSNSFYILKWKMICLEALLSQSKKHQTEQQHEKSMLRQWNVNGQREGITQYRKQLHKHTGIQTHKQKYTTKNTLHKQSSLC